MEESPSKVANTLRGVQDGWSSWYTNWESSKVMDWERLFLLRGFTSPEAVKLRRSTISPKGMGVNIRDWCSSWCIRAKVTSAPSSSRWGKMRLTPCNCSSWYFLIKELHTPEGKVLGTLSSVLVALGVVIAEGDHVAGGAEGGIWLSVHSLRHMDHMWSKMACTIGCSSGGTESRVPEVVFHPPNKGSMRHFSRSDSVFASKASVAVVRIPRAAR